MTSDDVCAWVRAARAAKGWTQDQLGEQLGVTKANVSHWETGKHEPSFTQLLKIRDLTGHPLADVMPAENWPLPRVRRESITALSAEDLASLQVGVLGMLDAIRASGVPHGSGVRAAVARAAADTRLGQGGKFKPKPAASTAEQLYAEDQPES